MRNFGRRWLVLALGKCLPVGDEKEIKKIDVQDRNADGQMVLEVGYVSSDDIFPQRV